MPFWKILGKYELFKILRPLFQQGLILRCRKNISTLKYLKCSHLLMQDQPKLFCWWKWVQFLVWNSNKHSNLHGVLMHYIFLPSWKFHKRLNTNLNSLLFFETGNGVYSRSKFCLIVFNIFYFVWHYFLNWLFYQLCCLYVNWIIVECYS
jgi:hypothetical protein